MNPNVTLQISPPRSGLFVYLLFLTAIFCVLELSFFLQCSGFYLADYQLVMSHIHIPKAILPGIFFFLFAQGLVHLGFTVLIWALTRSVCQIVGCSWKITQNVGFSLWGVGLLTVLIANQLYFPNSKYADLTRLFLPSMLAKGLFWLCLTTWSSILLILLYGAWRKTRYGLMGSMLIFFLVYLLYPAKAVIQDASRADKPNIIVIGFDAVRPDFLGYFGADVKTPHLDAYLSQSTVFAEALTPIARTFPAWMSIFTGNYPAQNHVRFDLADQRELDFTQTLPHLLQQQGYETVYAMDETRFSNIETRMGFDRVITPPVGINDFFLGTFNDFPLSNLIINTALGHWLFPYSFANRPAFVSYDPNSFLQLLKPELTRNRTKPLFLAVHFCLSHYPYFWKNYSYLETNKAVPHYQAAIARTDRLFNDFMRRLNQAGLLQHSIVILLSDHGEALELPGDRITFQDRYIAGGHNPKHRIPAFYPASFAFEKVDQSAGHGTDVLGLSQYHSLFAIRLYGMKQANVKTTVPGIVSLMDIKPTLLNMINVPYPPVSGHSLQSVILGQSKTVPAYTHYFMESDFSPASIRTVHPETRQVLFEGIQFFEIDPLTTRLMVKKSMADLILSSKQFATIHGSWMLALYPQEHGMMMPILVNLKTGYWTNDLATPFAMHSPAKQMLSAMQTFYGKDISKYRIQ